jgi:hypothetical protein
MEFVANTLIYFFLVFEQSHIRHAASSDLESIPENTSTLTFGKTPMQSVLLQATTKCPMPLTFDHAPRGTRTHNLSSSAVKTVRALEPSDNYDQLRHSFVRSFINSSIHICKLFNFVSTFFYFVHRLKLQNYKTAKFRKLDFAAVFR